MCCCRRKNEDGLHPHLCPPLFLRRGSFWNSKQYDNFGSKYISQSRELQMVTCTWKRVYLWANYQQEILFSLKSSDCNSTFQYQTNIWPHTLYSLSNTQVMISSLSYFFKFYLYAVCHSAFAAQSGWKKVRFHFWEPLKTAALQWRWINCT